MGRLPATSFLPMSRAELSARGWRELDVLLVTGDAYFDHPSHGAAVIGRVLERAGLRVGVIARPSWRFADAFFALGRPTLFAGVTAGAVDSVVANYTASGAKRRRDDYAPDGAGGGRPDLATLVYANRVREAFPGLPVVLGGIEASSRRFAYFDVQRGEVRRSLLVDSRAAILVHGPGEAPILEIAVRLAAGRELRGIPGTAVLEQGASTGPAGAAELPKFEDIARDRGLLVRQALAVEQAARPGAGRTAFQRYPEGVVTAWPRVEQPTADLDAIFDLPFTRESHPSYGAPIPALAPVRFSVISHRGCPGGCSFCALALHQGRGVEARSKESILAEVRHIAAATGFRGTISDVGGPTANAFGTRAGRSEACRECRRASCLHPSVCRHLGVDCDPLLDVLDRAASIAGVKRVLIGSGVRHDLALKDPRFIEAVARRHTGGQLKVAPEHTVASVLGLMRKPPLELFVEFERLFREASRRAGKEQYLVPYCIAGFPGCRPEHADAMGRWLAARGQRLEQIQVFMPLAGTLAAAYFAAGVDARGEPLFVPDARERARQKAILVAGGRPVRKARRRRS